MDYKGENMTFNVGVNHLSLDQGVWYALPDVIASVILSGKVPKVLEAVRFVPVGLQKGLKKSSILGVEIDPSKDNLVQLLVEERLRIKQGLKALSPDNPKNKNLESRAQAMKILVNAMSYGIFIELNPEDKKSCIEVHGLASFTTEENRHEKEGTFFYPLLGVMITAGSRLFLAMAEAKVRDLGGYHAYMDTDSIYVPPEYAQPLTEYFQKLNPYDLDIPLLKAEKDRVWFYGISSKRYVLYERDGDTFNLIDYKLHGLGHLTNPIPNGEEDWHAKVWTDILRYHYGMTDWRELEAEYGCSYAISRLTVTTPNVQKRFRKLNKGKAWCYRIKPFNFFLVGFSGIMERGRPVKPLMPYSKDPQAAVYAPFINYETGDRMEGIEYFKPLSITINQYIQHPESKFEGEIGHLKRKHIRCDDILHIGKEANKIDEQPLHVTDPQMFPCKDEIARKILAISLEDAGRYDVNKSTLFRCRNVYVRLVM